MSLSDGSQGEHLLEHWLHFPWRWWKLSRDGGILSGLPAVWTGAAGGSSLELRKGPAQQSRCAGRLGMTTGWLLKCRMKMDEEFITLLSHSLPLEM